MLCVYFYTQQQFYFRKFTTEDGLPNNTVFDIKEDHSGNMIIGTDNGLSVFNGNTFKNYTIKDGLYNPYITAVHVSQNGDIFLNCYNGAVQKFDGKTFTNTGISMPFELEVSTDNSKVFVLQRFRAYINSISKKGFLKSSNNIFLLSKNQIAKLLYENKTYRDTKIDPFYLQNNQLILVENGKAKYQNRTATIPKTNRHILEIIFRKNDVVYFTDTGFLYCDFHGNIAKEIALPKSWLEMNSPRCHILLDNQDQIWFNLQLVGLHKLEEKSLVNYSGLLGLHKNQNINNLFCDSRGRLWIPTNDNGLYVIYNQDIRLFNPDSEEVNFNSFAIDSNSELLAASRRNIYHFRDNTLFPIENTDKSSILSLITVNGKPMVTSSNMAVITKDNVTFGNHLPMAYGNSIFYYKNSLISQTKGNILHQKTSKSIDFTTSKELSTRVQNLFPFQNVLLYNSGKYLSLIDIDFSKDGNIKTKLIKPPFFKTTDFISTVIKKDDRTLIFAIDSKLYTMRDFKITDSISLVNGMQFGYVNHIYPEGDVLWLSTQKGLFKIDEKFGNRAYNKYNLLSDNEVNSSIVKDGFVFVATKNGLTKIPYSETQKATERPKLFLNYYKTDTIKPIETQKITLAPNEKALKIFLELQDYNSLQNTIIQYQLNQSDWLNTDNLFLDFPALSFGNHSLKVRAKNINSDWSFYTLDIIKEKPFYLKTAFIIFINILAFILIYSVLNQIYRKKKKEQNEKLQTENRILELRQQALFAMMNPHFVFNALSSIQYFINSNQRELGSEYLAKFSRLTREILNQADASFVTLSSETGRLEMYVELEQLRFQNFKFQINISDEIPTEQVKIPNMLLQPFVENAILHGVSPLKSNDGIIALSIHKNEENLVLIVTDNGFGKNEKQKLSSHTSKGIKMIKERLQVMQKNHPSKTFSISDKALYPDEERKWHLVEIIIPYELLYLA
ncbi:MAG: histidine kinase [Cruoricaptor ignavus]|nr:histidine kinase [Cruoricaptor ignavus]MDO5616077.1 histidine kinase [Cruoricaptor ignavus]